MSDLSRDEFLTHVGYLRADIAGINERLDVLNGRTRKLENLSAVHSWAIGLVGAGSAAVFVWVLTKL